MYALISLYSFIESRVALRKEKGAVAIEYALLASLIALAIIIGAEALGLKIGSVLTFITGKLKDA